MERYSSVFQEELEEPDEARKSELETSTAQEWFDIDSTTIKPKSSSGFRNLTAARSESWPWAAGKHPLKSSTGNDVSENNSETYIGILQSACQKGFPAPPRREVHEYQRKSLPFAPSAATLLGQSTRASVAPQQKTPSTRRVDSCNNVPDFEQFSETDRRSELVTKDFVRQSNNFVIMEEKPTWLSRIERRAESNRKARELLQKRE